MTKAVQERAMRFSAPATNLDRLAAPSDDGPDGLIGQVTSLEVAERFLDQLRLGPGSLRIEGEAGSGKTTLWRTVVERARARGYQILQARPVESEATLAFAALSDLLRNALPASLERLPRPQARALRVALLLEDPGEATPDQRAVSVASLNVVGALAGDGPVVIAVDDRHWLDAPTARVIEFAGRRLLGERVGLLMVERTDDVTTGTASGRTWEWAGQALETRPLPLLPAELDALFRVQLAATFTRPVVQQIAADSGGNPLFALELARAVQRGEVEVLPGQPLALPRTLAQLVHGSVTRLGPESREALFVAAAAADPSPDLLERAAGPHSRAALDEAVRAGIIEVPDDTIRFRHPLFAASVYHVVPPERRRILHGRLAQLARQPDERARHLSLSVEGPDLAVAQALREAARMSSARGAPDAAADLMQKSITLSPGGLDVQRLRLEEANYHFAAGETARARELLEELVGAAPPGEFRAEILRHLATVRYRHDDISVAAEVLTRAIDEAGGNPALLARIHRDLAWAITQCGDVRGASHHVRKALALVQEHELTPLLPEILAANALIDFLMGEPDPADRISQAVALERLQAEVPIEWQPSMMQALMLKWAGNLPGALAQLGDLHVRVRDAGEETSLPFVLAHLSEANTWAGAWRAALAAANQAYRLAVQSDQAAMRATALYARALVRAHLGDVDRARADAEQGLHESERAGAVITMMLNQSVLGYLELSVGDPERAHDWLGPLLNWLEVVGISEPGVLRFVPDEVEAMIGIGLLGRADEVLRSYERAAARLGRPWGQLAAARSRALHTAASGDVAGGAASLATALKEYAELVPPFERARSLLVLGSILRRTRRRREARSALEDAQGLFQELGASVWLARAGALLGIAETSEPATNGWRLTPSEERVADLVTAGLTNRDVASRLFVSVRAVEVHLTSIYRKAGITSRAALAARMTAETAHRPAGIEPREGRGLAADRPAPESGRGSVTEPSSQEESDP